MLNDNHTIETDCHFDFEYEYNPHTHLSEFEECFRCVLPAQLLQGGEGSRKCDTWASVPGPRVAAGQGAERHSDGTQLIVRAGWKHINI